MPYRPRRVSPLYPILTLLLGSVLLAALYFTGSSRPSSPRALDHAPSSSPIRLWEETEPYLSPITGEDVAPPTSDKTAETAPASYGEIIRQEEGVTVYRVHGKRHRGVLAVIDDPTRLFVGTLNGFGWRGMLPQDLVASHDALLGVNGGGFEDQNGQGNGGTPIGVVMTEGEFRWGGVNGSYDVCAFDQNGRLYTGVRTGKELVELGVQYAICYGPALIVDGQIQDFSAHYAYLEPRTAVGQREDGAVLVLVVEGRQVGALGLALPELAEVMASYGAINATNLDGGASSVMYYEDTLLNHPNGLGVRPIPSALLVRRSGKEEQQ